MSAVTQHHADELARGADELGVALDADKQRQLLAYLALLIKWNKAYNLTAVRDPDEMVSRHLLDSLSIVPYAEAGDNWLDVGSGGGMPGVPLAILFPQKRLTLLDSNGKKTRFLTQVKLGPTSKSCTAGWKPSVPRAPSMASFPALSAAWRTSPTGPATSVARKPAGWR